MRYGGNTSCVSMRNGDEPPFVFDLGTGLRYFGAGWPADRRFRGTALLTHLHWDHVQGLPFFVPLLRDGARLDVYAPVQEDGRSVHDAFDFFIRPPYFPVTLSDLGGTVTFTDVVERGVRDRPRHRSWPASCPTAGPPSATGSTWDGVSVAYLSDHQQPPDGSHRVSDGALELCDGADLVIHDAQYTPVEFAAQEHLGSLHGRVRRPGGPPGRRQAPGPVPPRPAAGRRRAGRPGPRNRRSWRRASASR